MENPHEGQQDGQNPEWMNDPDEIAMRLTANPVLYGKLYPDHYRALQNTNQQMLLDDPLFYVNEIGKYIESLPMFIDEAQTGPDSSKLRKLEVIQKSLTAVLRPSTPVHPDIEECIYAHERELNDYLLQVLTIKQHITDVKPVQEKRKTQDSMNKSPGFEAYIVETERSRLMPYLIEKYTDVKPEEHGYMLYALHELKYISLGKLNANKTALHRALTETFGKSGTRQALSTAMQRLDNREINEVDKLRIAKHKDRIVTYLSPKMTD